MIYLPRRAHAEFDLALHRTQTVCYNVWPNARYAHTELAILRYLARLVYSLGGLVQHGIDSSNTVQEQR